jgi:N4-gp56 family major capsid protein
MAFNTTINTTLLTTYLIRKFIPALEDELQFQKFTTKASIPQGMGNIARWNVFSSPPANTTSLSPEGAIGTGTTTTNEITTLTTTGTAATLAEYGEFIRTTRLEEYCAVPGSRDELSNRMAYGGARSIDALVRNACDGTTSDWYAHSGVAGGGTTTAAASPTYGADGEQAELQMSAAAVIGATAELRGNSARGFAGVNGHPNRHFACIMSTSAEQNMVQEATAGRMTWAEAVTDVPGASGQSKWVNGFMGSVYGTACYRSQALTTGVITATLDENFVLAEGGVGALSIIDADPQIYVNTSSSGDIGNPYRNSNTVAWHIFFATALIDSNRVIKVYSGTT